jgi:membrane fusion protein (multidrug efflux system)
MHDVAKPVGTSNVKRTRKAIFLAVLALVALFLAVAGIKALQIRKMISTPMVIPPTTVSSAVVKEAEWAPTLSAVGTISAVQGATVAAELGGTVAEVRFQNGGVAKQGDLLVKVLYQDGVPRY